MEFSSEFKISYNSTLEWQPSDAEGNKWIRREILLVFRHTLTQHLTPSAWLYSKWYPVPLRDPPFTLSLSSALPLFLLPSLPPLSFSLYPSLRQAGLILFLLPPPSLSLSLSLCPFLPSLPPHYTSPFNKTLHSIFIYMAYLSVPYQPWVEPHPHAMGPGKISKCPTGALKDVQHHQPSSVGNQISMRWYLISLRWCKCTW